MSIEVHVSFSTEEHVIQGNLSLCSWTMVAHLAQNKLCSYFL
jgi:hypothetical protein